METIIISLAQLRDMIGLRVLHQGQPCLVIEILEQDTQLVLQIDESHSIQADQHGDAHRVAPDTITIPVLTADKTELHTSFLALEIY